MTVIDTAGAALSPEAEEGGLAGEVARCLADLVSLPSPTLCLLLGQGGGVRRSSCCRPTGSSAQHSWLAPLPPEGASAFLYRTTERAPELAAEQRIRSLDLMRAGIADWIVAERPDAADGPTPFLVRAGQIHLAHPRGTPADRRR